MALSFLSLPSEARVQIYRYLLCHNTWIQPYRASDNSYFHDGIIARTRGTSLLTSVEHRPRTKYSPEIAILQTCRIIYAEAMPVVYGENSFLYESCTCVLNQANHPKARFPDKNLDFMKHLELEVQEEICFTQSIAEDVAAAILYFVRGGRALHTFKLSLFERGDLSEIQEYTGHDLIDNLHTSSELAASLVALQVSESLTISVQCSPFGYYDEPEIGKEARDKCQGMVNRLASAKVMTAIMEVDLPEREDDALEESYDYDTCKMSWCLRPQHPKPQSSTMPRLID